MLEKIEQDIIREVPQDDSTDREEKIILYEEIKRLKPKVVVETGTHRGKTSLYMLCAIAENGEGHLYTADPFEWGAYGNFAKFMDLHPYVTYFQIPGKELPPHIQGKIDFMFIDGFHEKHEVLAEIDALFPLLADNAVVYFHDTNGSNPSCDVPGAIDERGLKVEYLKTLNGIAKYEHNKDISFNSNNSNSGAGSDEGKPSKPKSKRIRMANGDKHNE